MVEFVPETPAHNDVVEHQRDHQTEPGKKMSMQDNLIVSFCRR